MKDRNQDAWHGIQGGSDGEDGVDKGFRNGLVRAPRRDGGDDGDEEESEEGGWDVVAAGKAKLGEEVDSSDDDDQSDENTKEEVPKKSVRFQQTAAPKRAKAANNLVSSLQDGEKRAQMSRQAQLWFAQPVFKDLDDLAALDGKDEDNETQMEDDVEDDDGGGGPDVVDEDGDVEMDETSVTSDTPGHLQVGHLVKATALADQLQDASDDDDFEIVPREPEDKLPGWDVDDEDQDEVKRKIIQGMSDLLHLIHLLISIKDKGLLTAEAVSMASALVNRQTTASKLIDDGFNRLSTFHKDGLPNWFLDEESKYYKPNIPITKEAINVLREKQRALDARPIKKIAEAKARKKFKAAQRVDKAKKKADGVMEADDLNMGEKARQIGKVMGKAQGKEKKAERKVVVAKGANRGVKGRPKGVKGRYKIVDARMRKEVS